MSSEFLGLMLREKDFTTHMEAFNTNLVGQKST